MTIKTKAPTFKVGDLIKKGEDVSDVEENPKTNTFEAVERKADNFTQWEEECVRFYIEGGMEDRSRTAAYRKARPKVTARWKNETVWEKASKFFASPKVKARINEVKEHLREETNISAEYVSERTKQIVERCMQNEQVFDRKGEAVIVQLPSGELAAAYAFQPMAALKGLDQLGRTLPDYYGGDGTPVNNEVPNISINFIGTQNNG